MLPKHFPLRLLLQGLLFIVYTNGIYGAGTCLSDVHHVLEVDTIMPDMPIRTGYRAPLKGALLVTGTFGELRSNHWHAGLDFRAATGTPVYAVREGFVSRIKVSPGGYGQAIYVDHPDGYRSVYAHLEALAPELKDTVRALQFITEAFAHDLHFDSLDFPVRLGQKIGEVGNRGHSFGSHLHFEMRWAASDAALNPLSFGFKVPDKRAPQIRSLRIYELDGAGQQLTATNYQMGRPGKGQRALRDTVYVNSPYVGVSVKAYDRQDAMPNWNGIYAARILVDSTYQSGFVHSEIPFEDTKYLNAQTDFREWTKNTSWYHRLWALSPLNSGTGPAMNDGAWVSLAPGKPRKVAVEIRDYAGNVSTADFNLIYRPGKEPQVHFPHQYFLPAGQESLIVCNGFSLYFPETALYQDLYFRFAELPDFSAERFSPTYQLHDELTPLHGRATLKIKPNRSIPDSLRAKVFIGQCEEDGSHRSVGGRLDEEGFYVARVGGFGDYALFLDTIPPTVRINSFPSNLSRYAGFSVLITDDVAGGELSYRGEIDGKWVLLEYDVKNDKLTHSFRDSSIGGGRHTFVLTVADARGNSTTWTRRFTK